MPFSRRIMEEQIQFFKTEAYTITKNICDVNWDCKVCLLGGTGVDCSNERDRMIYLVKVMPTCFTAEEIFELAL